MLILNIRLGYFPYRRLKIKIELIFPSAARNNQRQNKGLLPPLSLAMLAAISPDWADVSITDENVSPIDFEKKIDLAGISINTVTAPHAYRIADTFKQKGIKTVLGGIHPTAMPEEAIQHSDSVVIGEAENIWPSLLEDCRQNRLAKIYKSRQRTDLSVLPIPRRDLFKKKAYLIPNSISTTRGCPFSCTFCSTTSTFGNTYRHRPIERIIEEITTFKGRGLITFVDDNIVGNYRFSKKLFKELIPHKIKWIGQAPITIARDEQLLRLAADSGCIGLLIGFESISNANLSSVHKKIDTKEYEKCIKKIHSCRIAILGSFIFGFDEDRRETFKQTLDFSQKMKLESAQFNILKPYPGTFLYQSMYSAGRIFTKDWSRYESEVVFQPKNISPEELQKETEWVWSRFYSLPSVLKRLGLIRSHPLIPWLMNLHYMGERVRDGRVFKKIRRLLALDR